MAQGGRIVLSLHRFRFVTSAVVLSSLASGARAAESFGVEAYVQAVLRSHPGAGQVAAFEAAARAENRAARQIADPSVAISWDRASVPGSPDKGSAETGVAISQSIPWPGTFSANAQAGDQAAEVLRAEGMGTRWDLELQARSAFAQLLYARAALDIAVAAEADAKGLRDLTAKRAELGEAREVDRIKAEVEWLRQQRSRRSRSRAAEAAEAILRALAGEPLPEPLRLEGELPLSIPPTEAVVLRERLGSSPRLAAARAAAKREAALLTAARRARVPDLDVTWFRSKELDKKANGFTVAVRVPLWNANRGAIARAAAATAQASAARERVLLDLTTALEHARQDLDVSSLQAEMLERDILPAATRSLDLARFSYQEGETSLLDLLDAQRTFRETQHEAVASRLALAMALAEVQRLVGPDFGPGR
jgi:cobalt-zinc-cadmium efflux system outer membrane protein